MFFVYWFGGELNPLFDLFISIPWWLHIVPITIFSVIYALYIQKIPHLGIMLIVIFAVPFIFTVRTVPERLPARTNDTIKTCLLNTKYYFANTDIIESLILLRNEDCDIYFFQEVWRARENRPQLEENISQIFQGYFAEYRGEFVTLSRFFIESSNLGPHEGYLKTVVTKNDLKISLYNVHFWNPLFDRPCQSFEDRIYAEKCLIPAFDIRKMQADELRAELAADNSFIVIGGDFNSMQNSKIIQDLKTRFVPFYSETFGLNSTFQSNLPLIKIDFVFVPQSVKLARSGMKRVCLDSLSDHCLSITQFDIR